MDAAALILLILFMIGVGLALYYAVICFQVHPLREKTSRHSDMGPLLEQDMNGNNEDSPFTPSALLQQSLDSPDAATVPKRKANPVSPVPGQEDNLELPPRPIDLKITPGCASKDPPKEGCVVLPIDEEPSVPDSSKPLRHSKEPTPKPAPALPLPQRFPPISPMHLLAGPDCFEEDGLRVPNPLQAQRPPQPEKEKPIGFVCPTDAVPQQCGPPRRNPPKQVHFITPPVFAPCFVNDTNNPPQFGQSPPIKTTPVHSSNKCESSPTSKSLPNPEHSIICDSKHKSDDDDVTPTPKRVKHNLKEEPILEGVCVDLSRDAANRSKERASDPSSPSPFTTNLSTHPPKTTNLPASSPPQENCDENTPQDNGVFVPPKVSPDPQNEKDDTRVIPPPSIHPHESGSPVIPLSTSEPPLVPHAVSEPSVVSFVPAEPVLTFTTSEPYVSPVASEPSTVPIVSSKPSSEPLITSEPSAAPLVTAEPSAAPLVELKHSAAPLVESEPSAVLLVESEPSVVPLVESEPSVVPLVTSEPSVDPLVESEPSAIPLVSDHPVVQLVASEPTSVHVVTSNPTVTLIPSEPSTNPLMSDLSEPVKSLLSNSPSLKSDEIEPTKSLPPDAVDSRPPTYSEITEGELPDSPSATPETNPKTRSQSSLGGSATESDSEGEISTTTSSDPDVTEYSFHPGDPDVSLVLANEVSSYSHDDSVGLTNYSNLPESPAPPPLKVQPLNSDHPPTPTSDTTKSPSPITCNDILLDEMSPSHSPSNLIGTPPSTPPGDTDLTSYILKPPTQEESPGEPPGFFVIKVPKTSRQRHDSTSSSSSDSSSSTSNGSYKLGSNFKEDPGPVYVPQSFPQRRKSPSDIPPRLK